MRKTLIISAIAMLLAATTAAAWADCYINPKADIVLVSVSKGCHAWGASVRCDLDGAYSGWADFRFKNDKNIGCAVYITRNGNTKWNADTRDWHQYWPDNKKVICSQYWVNNNTLDVTGKRQ